MKMLISTAVAGSMLAASTLGAAADPWKYGPPHPLAPPPHVTSGNIAGAAIAGAFLGYAIGSLFAPQPVLVYPPGYYVPPPVVYPPTYYALTPHQAWCINTYGQAYDPGSDAWYDVYGYPRPCISPRSSG